MSINRLSLIIQEKISKLNAGNLSMEELDELKELTTELNERVIVLQYKAAEAQLLKQAGEIIEHKEPKEKVQAPELAAPIKLDLGASFTPSEKPLNKPVEAPEVKAEIPVEKKVEIPEVKIQPVVTEPQAEKKPETPPVENKPQIPVMEKKQDIPVKEIPAPAVTPQPAKVSLLERMQKTKINDLKTAIGLNQKFLFMNYLFEGENSSYNDAIEKLNNMPTAADARHYIRELAYIYNWDYEDENVITFTEYVERRYL